MITKKEDLYNTKVWIGNDPELSKKIQERAFELGLKWQDGDSSVSMTKQPFLCFDKDTGITYGFRELSFKKHPNKEITPEEILGIKKPTKQEFERVVKWLDSFIIGRYDEYIRIDTITEEEYFMLDGSWISKEEFYEKYVSQLRDEEKVKRLCDFKTTKLEDIELKIETQQSEINYNGVIQQTIEISNIGKIIIEVYPETDKELKKQANIAFDILAKDNHDKEKLFYMTTPKIGEYIGSEITREKFVNDFIAKSK